LFILKLFKVPLTLVTLMLTAKLFGATISRDIWLLGYSVLQSIDLAIWGPINETFRAKYVTIVENLGQNTALSYTRSLLFFILVISIVISVIVFAGSSEIAKLIAPQFSSKSHNELVIMLRLLTPWLLVNQIVLIKISILNANNVFYVPEIASFISQILNILFLIFFAERLGIYSLVIGLYISTIILLVLVAFNVKKLNLGLYSKINVSALGFKVFFLFSLPFFIPYFVGQLNGMIEKSLAVSLGKGILSVLDFSRRIPDIISGVLSSVILSILVPNLTRHHIKGNQKEFQAEFLATFRLGLFLLAAIVIFFFCNSQTVVNLLYSSKNIAGEEMLLISELTTLYSVSSLGIFAYVIFGMAMMAMQKSRLYVIIGILAQVLVILMNIFLVKFSTYYIFPISIAVSHFCCGIIMLSYFQGNKLLLVKEFLKYIGLIAICCVVIMPLISFIQIRSEILKMTMLTFIQGVVILLVGSVIKIEEVKDIKKMLKTKLL